MDFMLEEDLVDLMTACLTEPGSPEDAARRERISAIGREIFDDGGLDALENFFFVLKNRISGETGRDPSPLRPLWNGITDGWKH